MCGTSTSGLIRDLTGKKSFARHTWLLLGRRPVEETFFQPPCELAHDQPSLVVDETPLTDGSRYIKNAQLPAPLTSAVRAGNSTSVSVREAVVNLTTSIVQGNLNPGTCMVAGLSPIR